MTGSLLAFTDDAVLPVSSVFNVIKELEDGGVEKRDPLIITQVSLLSNFLRFPEFYDNSFFSFFP